MEWFPERYIFLFEMVKIFVSLCLDLGLKKVLSNMKKYKVQTEAYGQVGQYENIYCDGMEFYLVKYKVSWKVTQ